MNATIICFVKDLSDLSLGHLLQPSVKKLKRASQKSKISMSFCMIDTFLSRIFSEILWREERLEY